MTWQRRLATALNVQPAEEHLVLLLLLHSFFLGVALTFTETVANTLLLVNFGAGALPYVYIGFAVVSSATGLAYSWFEVRLPFGQFLVATLATMALSLVVLWSGLALPGQVWAVAVLAVWCEVLWVLAGLEFGALLGRFFTLRQGKRLFGLVGSGEVLAGALGGLLVPLAVRLVGTANLLLLAAIGLGGALVSLLAILRAQPLGQDVADSAEEERPPLALRALLQSRYLLLMLGFAVFALFSYFVLDNLFYIELDARYPDDEQLASVLGIFYALAGGLTLLVKGVLAGRLLQRYGLAVGLLLMPAAVAVGAALVLGSALLLGGLGLFWLIALSKLLNEVLKDAVDTPVSLILYQPLLPAERNQIQTLIESVVEPVAAGLAGVLLIVLTGPLAHGSNGLALILGALLIMLIVIGRALGRAYQGALRSALDTQRLGGLSFSLQDSSTRAAVLRALHSDHPGEVIYALDLLEQGEAPELAGQLAQLLGHPDPQLREAAFARVERLRLAEVLPAVRERLAVEREPAVVEAGLRALALLSEDEAFEELAGRLDAPERSVQRGALVGLLRNGGISGVLAAGDRLIQLSRAPDADARALAAQILGAVGIRSFYQPLLPLLHDDDLAVRREAIQAAGQIGHPRLWAAVVGALAQPELRVAAEAALLHARGDLAAIARASFAQADLPLSVRLRLTRACGRVGGEAMADLLRPYLDAAASAWRSEICGALHACRYQAVGPAVAGLRAQLRREAAIAAWLLATRHDIAGGPPAELLIRALEHGLLLARTRILLLLGTIFPPRLIEQVRVALEYGSAEQRSYAIESLDGLLPADLKPALLPLLDDLTPAEQLRRRGALFPQALSGAEARVSALVAGDDAPEELWLRACACYTAGQQAREAYRPALQIAAAAADLLLRHEALSALSRLGDHVPQGATTVYSQLEKVMILKTVSIFAATEDSVLSEIASILKEREVSAGEQIFAEGDHGTSMYIIVSGRVRVHNGERTLNELGARAVFGEMAMLDPEPRIASVTALELSRLFWIDHTSFYEVMADRVEVARGIIRVLIGHLRARVRDIAVLHERVQALEEPAGGASD